MKWAQKNALILCAGVIFAVSAAGIGASSLIAGTQPRDEKTSRIVSRHASRKQLAPTSEPANLEEHERTKELARRMEQARREDEARGPEWMRCVHLAERDVVAELNDPECKRLSDEKFHELERQVEAEGREIQERQAAGQRWRQQILAKRSRYNRDLRLDAVRARKDFEQQCAEWLADVTNSHNRAHAEVICIRDR